jgi:hypothetical protein
MKFALPISPALLHPLIYPVHVAQRRGARRICIQSLTKIILGFALQMMGEFLFQLLLQSPPLK